MVIGVLARMVRINSLSKNRLEFAGRSTILSIISRNR
jgi:hypothetical protein